jgi:hypothetical protein
MKLLAAVQRMVDATAPMENNHTTPTTSGPQLEDPPREATVWVASAEAVAALVTATAAAGEQRQEFITRRWQKSWWLQRSRRLRPHE